MATTSDTKTIRLPVCGITVELSGPTRSAAGSISSDLHNENDSPALKAALEAVESMVLAHACAGISITATAYIEGIETALDAIGARLS
jgi:uncharacterized membrane protein YqgA involved in biofilm formation